MFVKITRDIVNPTPMQAGEVRELPKEWLQPDSMMRLGPTLRAEDQAVLIPWVVPLKAE